MAAKPPNLAVVFGAPKKDMPGADMKGDDKSSGEDDDEDAESDEALDAAIDDVFDAKDPEARREAFKNAVRLCGESKY